jgi:galactoside O-acetyltransferase
MNLKRLARGVLLRCLNAARAEEALRIRERALRQTRLGQRCIVDFSRVGWRQGSALILGDDAHFAGAITFERENSQVEIGSRTYFASLISCAERINIGCDVLVSGGGLITDHGSHAIEFRSRVDDVASWNQGRKDWSTVAIKPVTIEDKAWIGWGVTILRGVTIGEGAVVGANSVVTKNVLPYTVVVGNPARLLRELGEPLAANSRR